ncbi:hypothetical protein DNAM5_142 [Haloarcula californiae tailed virus 1]|uniref:Uncharacterized protein n=1 Tax=Haloarcula californiae tailed virus 1 TaxID=1273746 RepID=R4T897_9CAUD|nr:hypothetical protein M202_gp079 [Haloarcula californiae tailed virus 1]AGM11999.1 hypothetical protein DNAM5_142 [Haloarcula californiae tailed virus 1]
MGQRTKTKEKIVQRERTETRTESEVVEEEVVVAVCDFCDQEYEDLDPSDLNTILINPTTPPRETSETVRVPMEENFNRKVEMYRALMECRSITTQRKRVMDSEPNFSEDPNHVPTFDTFDEDLRSDVIAYEFTIHVPTRQRAEAELEVCDHCKEAFQE